LFPLTVENTTLAAGENEARDPAHLIIGSPNQQDKAAVSDHVESTDSRRADAQVTVSVYNDAQVPPDILARAEDQAAKIFLRVRLEVTWLLCTHTNSRARPQPVTVWTSQPTSRYGSSVIHQAPLAIARSGVAFLSPDGTGRYSDVFWKRTQSLHASSNVDLGGILGSVIAHEMGHLLLGSNAHAISGIMRPHWESGELHRIAMGTLMFLPAESKRMHESAGSILIATGENALGTGGPAAKETSAKKALEIACKHGQSLCTLSEAIVRIPRGSGGKI
jgi:hypothetical protein